MKNFIALYLNTTGAHQTQPDLTPEQQEQILAPWGAWKEKYGDQIIDLGAPCMPAVASDKGDNWSPSKNFVTGYSIVSANNIADAQEMFKGHPIYSYPGHAIEISECISM